MLEHKIRRIGPVFIIDLAGRVSMAEAIAFGPGSGNTLREIVRGVLEEGAQKVLINLTEVSYIDSSGIGELFGAYSSLQRQGGQLKLLNPNRAVREVLKLTKMNTILDVRDDEFEAIQAFDKPATAAGG